MRCDAASTLECAGCFQVTELPTGTLDNQLGHCESKHCHTQDLMKTIITFARRWLVVVPPPQLEHLLFCAVATMANTVATSVSINYITIVNLFELYFIIFAKLLSSTSLSQAESLSRPYFRLFSVFLSIYPKNK